MTNSGKVGLVSLGCPKALVDSEDILTALAQAGYQAGEDTEGADLIIINTCGFIEPAVEESLCAIEDALADNGRVIVTGCLGSHAEALRAQFPELLEVTGPQATERVLAAVRRQLPEQGTTPLVEPLLAAASSRLTPPHYAYLKISEGCNHKCSFCIIPTMRGKLRSRPLPELLDEARAKVAAGAQELLVIAQDTSAYGLDRRYETVTYQGRSLRSDLETLCRELGAIAPWVRLHYVYPYPHVDALIPLMAEGLILPYLDVPLQHASAPILKAMRRPAATAKALERIQRWREVCPDLRLRSTFIVGFPGETDADFELLLDFLDAAELDRVGCFPYSDVPGAAANDLADPVEEAVKLERAEWLLEVQAGISARRLDRWLGRDMEVLVDAVATGTDTATARSPGDAPEIDGTVAVQGGGSLRPGERTWVRITGHDDHDLQAEYLGNPVVLD